MNREGEQALVFCTAVLFPEADNPHDLEAVAVHIAGTKVGYLAREMAHLFRKRLLELGAGLCATSCDAVIHGGWQAGDRFYDYSIELDFDIEEGSTNPFVACSTYPKPKHLKPTPALVSRSVEEFFIEVPLLSRDTLAALHLGCGFAIWTKPELDDIYLFAEGSVGGSNRVAVLPKTLYPGFESDLDRFHVTAFKIAKRSLIIRGGLAREKRFAFLDCETARCLFVDLDIADSGGAVRHLALIDVEISQTRLTLLKEHQRYVHPASTEHELDRDLALRLVRSCDFLVAHRSGAANLNSAISGNSGHKAGPTQVWREGVFDGQEIRAAHPPHAHAGVQGPGGTGCLA